MIKPRDPRQLAVDLLPRSICAVQVAAVLADDWGIYSWGINHVGYDGLGCHAERQCLLRANRSRHWNATMYVAAQRRRNRKAIPAKPCPDCQGLVKVCRRVVWRDGNGEWIEL